MSASTSSASRGALSGVVERLPPAYFAFVMATGIVAITWHLHGFVVIPEILGGLNWAVYVLLWALVMVRMALFRQAVLRDLSDHLRGVGFYTMIAGTSVLGAQTIAIEHGDAAGVVLWCAAIAFWIAIMYSFLLSMAVTTDKPPLQHAINGGWLVAVVATQSITVLGCAVGSTTSLSEPLQFMCVAFFLAGLLLYLVIITLIFYRTFFMQMAPQEFGPLYWIDTGAAAISTLAGSSLLLRAGSWPIVSPYTPFLQGATLFVWAAATFWLPFLILMTVWRYGVRRDRFQYGPGLWGMVFPLGMYSAATFELARAEGLAFLKPLSQAFAYVSLGAWLLTAGAFVAQLTFAFGKPDGPTNG